MLEQRIRFVSENLARALDRRQFIKKTGSAVFAGLVALAAGHNIVDEAEASGARRKSRLPLVPVCNPPGPYCNTNGTNEPNGCLNSQPGGPFNSRCLRHMNEGQMLYCRVSYYWYQSGCWTYAADGGYWTCCDCECSVDPGGPEIATCGCAGFSLDPVPDPDRPASPARVTSTARG
jgi:hypothetical protein